MTAPTHAAEELGQLRRVRLGRGSSAWWRPRSFRSAASSTRAPCAQSALQATAPIRLRQRSALRADR